MAMQIGFGWNPQRSAYQNITAQRTRLANYASSTQATLNAASNMFASASTNQISGTAKLAAQQAVLRLSTQIKAANAARNKQLSDAQATLVATQKAYNAGQTSTVGNGGSVNIAA
ncbi:MAG: hypothetical protein JSR72_07830 [Proteobacteria bacterium]|nr:hypothetical protein [Pseudomonadota bacterium]